MSEQGRARRQRSAMNSTSRYQGHTAPTENVNNPDADRKVVRAIRECGKILKTVDLKHRHRVVAGLRATLNVSAPWREEE